MKITIVGASAGIGLAAVSEAINRGHEVTVLSTNTSSIPDHALLTKVNGSATSIFDMKKVMLKTDAVLITIGTKNKKPNTLFSDTAKVLVQAATELDFKAPVLVITGFGAGESSNYLSLFMRLVIRLFLKNQYHDKTLMEEVIAQSPLKWVMVRPGMLSDGPLTKRYRVLITLSKGMKIAKIARADVAHFLVSEAENAKLLGQYPALSY